MSFPDAVNATSSLGVGIAASLTSTEAIAAATYASTLLGIAGVIFSVLAYVHAKRAKTAAAEAKSAVYNIDSVSGLSKAATSMREAQNHMRSENLSILPDKFLSSISYISTVRSSCTSLVPNEQEDLLQVISQLRATKDAVEIALEKKEKLRNVARLNSMLTDQIEKLYTILEEVKRR